MASFRNRFINNFISQDIPLEKRITNIMVFFAIIGELFGFIESLSLKLARSAIILTVVSFFILLVIFIWGLKTSHTKIFSIMAISLIGMIIFPLMFLANAGLDGGMPFYMVLAISCAALALRKKTRIIVFFLLMIEYSALFVLYKTHPQYFIPMTPEDSFFDQLLSMIIACSVLFFFSYTVSHQGHVARKKFRQLSSQFEKEANTDELTGLYNRRYFKQFLNLALNTLGNSENLHIAMFDIDDFKLVNDEYGHPFGDVILKRFADLLRRREKLGATVCRYGGEEFLILIPQKDRSEALKIVEDILEETRTTIEITEDSFITVSAGFFTCEEGLSYEKLLETVDENLYKAKESGKNRVIY
ncbi:MAG: GGDEF domain-containing protein [Treponema sp.]|nr:GGDEF domain-containing protein [Treponema sp.]